MTKEPCPRCGKMLKPLTPKVKARDPKLRAQFPAEADGPEHPAGTRRHECQIAPTYTCQNIDDQGTRIICGSKHKTIAAAERCLRSDPPGIFRQYEGLILECRPDGSREVVKRFHSAPKVSIRGRTGSLRAVWVEAPLSPAATAGPAASSDT